MQRLDIFLGVETAAHMHKATYMPKRHQIRT